MIALETIAFSLGVIIIVAATFVLFIGGLEYADRDRAADDDEPGDDEPGTGREDEPAGTAGR